MMDFERFLMHDAGISYNDIWNLYSMDEHESIVKKEFERWVKIDNPSDLSITLTKRFLLEKFGWRV